MIAWTENDGEMMYTVQDHLGSPMLTVDGQGSVISKHSFSAYGASTTDNPVAFNGKLLDEETGLVYYGFRFFDTDMGRWLTPDPLGYTDGPNIYAYCGNDPVNYVDPLGLFSAKEAVLFGLGWSRAGRDSLLPYIFGNNPSLNSLIDPLQNKIIGSVLGVDESAFTTEAGSLKEAIPVYGFKLQCEKMGTACGTGSAYSKGYQSFMTIQSFGGNGLLLYGLGKGGVNLVKGLKNKSPILFGQKGISPTFNKKGSFQGADIDEIVAKLKSGALKPKDIRIQYIFIKGKKVVINNRSLAALSKAGMKPVNIVDMTNKLPATGPNSLMSVLERLEEMGGQPSYYIPVRSTSDWNSLPREIIGLPD